MTDQHTRIAHPWRGEDGGPTIRIPVAGSRYTLSIAISIRRDTTSASELVRPRAVRVLQTPREATRQTPNGRRNTAVVPS